MNTKYIKLIFAIIALALTSLACGIGAKVTPTPAFTATPQPTATAAVKLSDEQRMDEYGFIFRAAPGYQLDTAIGVQMLAPGADPDTGPAFMLVGGVPPDANVTAESLIASFKSAEIEQGEVKTILVDGVSGLAAGITRPVGNLSGRVVAVMVNPDQEFIMFAMAPQAQWDQDVAALFEAVLGSVKFVEVIASASPSETSTPESKPSSEIRQWATSATASSAFGTTGWIASQATGAPNVFECVDDSSAWASASADSVEWLELTYATPVIPSAINIHQSYNPGQIVKVELLDTTGKYHTVYTATPAKAKTCPGVLQVALSGADYTVVSIKLTVDQSVIMDWAEIDAVELVGLAAGGSTPNPGQAGIDPKSGLPLMAGATDVYATETTLNYSVKADLAAARAFYLAELPRLGWLLDLDDKGKCRDNDRCMGWHGGYDDPATTTFFFLQGEHAYLTLNLIENNGLMNVVIGVDPEYKK